MRLEKAYAISVVSLLVIGLSLAIARAETLRDQITVNLPYRVLVGDKVLDPGPYTIRDTADTRVEITPTTGAASATVHADVVRRITTFDEPAKETKVALHHIGNDYYFDRIWMQGRGDYYQFDLPDTVKPPEEEKPVEITAQYRQVSADQASSAVAARTTR